MVVGRSVFCREWKKVKHKGKYRQTGDAQAWLSRQQFLLANRHVPESLRDCGQESTCEPPERPVLAASIFSAEEKLSDQTEHEHDDTRQPDKKPYRKVVHCCVRFL